VKENKNKGREEVATRQTVRASEEEGGGAGERKKERSYRVLEVCCLGHSTEVILVVVSNNEMAVLCRLDS
jgi:hypothetical protein